MGRINEIFKVEGKYAIKRVYSAIVLGFSLILATYIVVSDYMLKHEINRYAIEALELLILFTGGLIGMDEFSKRLTTRGNKENTKKDE